MQHTGTKIIKNRNLCNEIYVLNTNIQIHVRPKRMDDFYDNISQEFTAVDAYSRYRKTTSIKMSE